MSQKEVFYDIFLAMPQVLKLELLCALCQCPNLLRPCLSQFCHLVFKLGLDRRFKALVRKTMDMSPLIKKHDLYFKYLTLLAPPAATARRVFRGFKLKFLLSCVLNFHFFYRQPFKRRMLLPRVSLIINC